MDQAEFSQYYQQQLREGVEFQDFIAEQLHLQGIVLQSFSSKKYQLRKENMLGLEIKFDKKYANTGNLYVETAEKASIRDGPYAPSGIFRDDGCWLFGIGNRTEFFVFAKTILRLVVSLSSVRLKEKGLRKVETPTSRGILFPRAFAASIAAKIFLFDHPP